jgi:hypothetical protein
MLGEGVKESIIPQSIDITRQQLGYTDAVVNAVNEITLRTSNIREEVLLKHYHSMKQRLRPSKTTNG